MTTKRILLEVTEAQLNDLLSCVHQAHARNLGYGHGAVDDYHGAADPTKRRKKLEDYLLRKQQELQERNQYTYCPVNTFHSSNRYVLERRDPQTGALDFQGTQPPFYETTLEDMWSYYWTKVDPNNMRSGRAHGTRQQVAKWFAEQSWFFRPKTWY